MTKTKFNIYTANTLLLFGVYVLLRLKERFTMHFVTKLRHSVFNNNNFFLSFWKCITGMSWEDRRRSGNGLLIVSIVGLRLDVDGHVGQALLRDLLGHAATQVGYDHLLDNRRKYFLSYLSLSLIFYLTLLSVFFLYSPDIINIGNLFTKSEFVVEELAVVNGTIGGGDVGFTSLLCSSEMSEISL